jgi:protein TonB
MQTAATSTAPVVAPTLRIVLALALSLAVHGTLFGKWQWDGITLPALTAFEPLEVAMAVNPGERAAKPAPVPADEPRPIPDAVTRAAPEQSGDGDVGAEPLVQARSEAPDLNNPRPPYPLAARRLGLQGRVLLAVQVGADGVCNQVLLKRSSGHAVLDDAALGTVRRWRFIPARRGDEAVASWVDVPVTFRIEG